jgi:periplasmic divalent cation tolerance protein
MSEPVLVGLLTTPDRASAEKIVDQLVQEGLIACGNMLGAVASVYRWQGAVARAEEILVILKTTEARASSVVARIRELHAYDVPEVLFLPVSAGYEAYIQWVRDSVKLPQDTEV